MSQLLIYKDSRVRWMRCRTVGADIVVKGVRFWRLQELGEYVGKYGATPMRISPRIIDILAWIKPSVYSYCMGSCTGLKRVIQPSVLLS